MNWWHLAKRPGAATRASVVFAITVAASCGGRTEVDAGHSPRAGSSEEVDAPLRSTDKVESSDAAARGTSGSEPATDAGAPVAANAQDLASLEAALRTIPAELTPLLDPDLRVDGDPADFPAAVRIGDSPVEIIREFDPGSGTDTGTGKLVRIATVKKAPEGAERRSDSPGEGGDNDVLHGPEWRYYPSGALQSITWWRDDVRHGPVQQWREVGTLEFEGRFHAGVRDGLRREFSSEGNLMARMVYVDAEIEGEFERWYPDAGQLKSRETFRRGQLNGRRQLWTLDGALAVDEFYVGGLRNGPFRDFHPDTGQPRTYGELVDGRPHGTWTESDSSGTVIAVTEYRDGVRNGVSKLWNAALGQLVERAHYVDGKKTGPARTWFTTGEPQSSGRYEGGARVGQWEYRRVDGSLNDTWSGIYENDDRVAPLEAATDAGKSDGAGGD